MKNKGFYPLFTTIGLMLVLMALAVNIHWASEKDSEFGSHISRLSYLRANYAVENVRAMAASTLQDIFYEAMDEALRIPEGETVNHYLTRDKEEGWELMLIDISEKASAGFSDAMPLLADYYDGYGSTFFFEEGLNITIEPVKASGIRLLDEGGLVASVRLPLIVSGRYQGWEASMSEGELRIPLNARLKEMYERAWDFHRNYEENTKWLVSGVIYARAYANAYAAKDGPFLKEGHFDFDPVATILFGKLQDVKEFISQPDAVKDIGAIPLATWLAESWYLSEPSFLPPSIDISLGDSDWLNDAASGLFDSAGLEEEACSRLSGQDREDCMTMYDTARLKEIISKLEEQRSAYEDTAWLLESWLRDYDLKKYYECRSCDDDYDDCYNKCRDKRSSCIKGCTSSKCKKKCRDRYDTCLDRCDTRYDRCNPDKLEICQERALNNIFPPNSQNCDIFREESSTLIKSVEKLLDDVKPEHCESMVRSVRNDYVRGVSDSDIKSRFENNDEEYGLTQTEGYCDLYVDALKGLKKTLQNDLKKSDISDSRCKSSAKGDCLFDSGCNDESGCNVRCSWPRCPSSSYSYECVGDKPLGYNRRVECKNCDDDYCWKDYDIIDQCTCRCRPSVKLVDSLYWDFFDVHDYIGRVVTALDKNLDKLEEQLQRQEELEKLQEKFENAEAESLGYDVFSRIEPVYVKYDMGELSGRFCYHNATFRDIDKGVCGDMVESVIVYTVQVALASFVGAGSFAADFFPMFFETEAKYKMTTTLIDDANRNILRNLAGDGKLYTYAPLEFEIYRDREFSMGSVTLGRTIVYVYLKSVHGGLSRVLQGLSDGSCKGEGC
jgi:hypothetical protein